MTVQKSKGLQIAEAINIRHAPELIVAVARGIPAAIKLFNDLGRQIIALGKSGEGVATQDAEVLTPKVSVEKGR